MKIEAASSLSSSSSLTPQKCEDRVYLHIFGTGKVRIQPLRGCIFTFSVPALMLFWGKCCSSSSTYVLGCTAVSTDAVL